MEKTCTICKLEKDVSSFNKNSSRKNGYRSECKDCRKKLTKEYRLKNVDKINEYNTLYRRGIKKDNPKLTVEEKKKKVSKYTTNYIKDRSKIDNTFRIKIIVRCAISKSFKNGYTKRSKTQSILGISYEDFKYYIESQFTDNMSWDNYGKWELDHKIPISRANTEEDIYRLNHYTNFQPLWMNENRKKGNK